MGKTEEIFQQIKSKIAEKLLFSRNPVILWSGGLDSTVVLFIARLILPDVNILQFRSEMRPEQLAFSDEIIKKENLKVFVYQPFRRFIVPSENDSVALVEDYAVGRGFIPVVRDLIHDDRYCLIDIHKAPVTENFPFPFDVGLVGWLKDDTHKILGDYKFPGEIQIGESLFYAPLVNYTKREIEAFAAFLEIPVSDFYKTQDERLDTGNLLACSRCFSQKTTEVFCPKTQNLIKGAEWDAEEMLTAFRSRLK